jgi:hypothetical protein
LARGVGCDSSFAADRGAAIIVDWLGWLLGWLLGFKMGKDAEWGRATYDVVFAF